MTYRADLSSCVGMVGPSRLVEVLFTPEWSAVYDPASRERWSVDALLNPRTVESLCHLAQGGAGSSVDSTGVPVTLPPGPRVEPWSALAAQRWCDAGWEEPLRHYLHTNLLPKIDYSNAQGWREDFSTMRNKVEESPVPPLTKLYPGSFPRSPLGVKGSAAPACVDPTLAPSKTRGATPEGLSSLLRHTFAVTGHKSLAVSGRHICRTSPSGGSRHPTEAYVFIFDVEGINPGAYHFDATSPSLALIRAGQWRSVYMKEVAGLNRRVRFEPSAAIVLTSVVERSMHRYRDSRSYRVLHLDAGHLLMTLQMIAESRGLQYFGAYSLGEKAAESLLGLDGLMETAMCQFLLA